MKTIKQIIREEIDDFDWVHDHEPTQEDIIKFIKDNPDETLWRFGKHWEGNLNLFKSNIKDLGELRDVWGYLDLMNTPIQSLGNLEEVGWSLDLENTPIQSLGNLKSVGGRLFLKGTPLSRITTEDKIRTQVNVTTGVWL